MKKYTSVLFLLARSTVYPILGVLVLMAAAEAALFYHVMPMAGERCGLETLVQQAHLSWVFAAAFLAVSVLLLRTGCARGTKVGYTLMRLSISERNIFVLQSIYNVLCYLLLWAVQVLLAMGLSTAYAAYAPADYVTGQTVFLAFYWNDFFHSLLPFEDIGIWLSNLTLLLSLGICTAQYPMGQRTGKNSPLVFVLMGAVLLLFIRGIGQLDTCAYLLLVSVICALFSCCMALRKEAQNED